MGAGSYNRVFTLFCIFSLCQLQPPDTAAKMAPATKMMMAAVNMGQKEGMEGEG
jgi:hypothetical protein